MSEEEKGFTVKDRRLFSEDGSRREDQPAEKPAPDAPGTAPESPAPGEGRRAKEAAQAFSEAKKAEDASERRQAHQLPPVEFSGLVLSLAHAALLHLGQIPGPDGNAMPADFQLARHTIDTIAMLRDKTKGNLTKDEQELIDTSLTDLRLVFVKLRG